MNTFIVLTFLTAFYLDSVHGSTAKARANNEEAGRRILLAYNLPSGSESISKGRSDASIAISRGLRRFARSTVFDSVYNTVSHGNMQSSSTDMEGQEDHHMGTSARDRCIPITIPLCQDIQYNRTIAGPNIMGQSTQADAALEAQQFYPLVKINCSPHLQFFLCTAYAPICSDLEDPVPPCRELCESARGGCEHLMNKFGFLWPPGLDCNAFPSQKLGGVCVPKDDGSNGTTGSSDTDSLGDHTGGSSGGEDGHSFTCPAQLHTADPRYRVTISGKATKQCGLPCRGQGAFFNDDDIKLSRNLVGFSAFFLTALALFTLLSFLVDRQRFEYPERPLIYLALCSFVVCLVYVVGYFLGDRVACSPVKVSSTEHAPSDGKHRESITLITQGNDQPLCTLLAVTLYLFTLSGAIWWVNLTVSWYLAAGRKWANEAIKGVAHYFHCVAWIVPAFMAMGAYGMAGVEGDVLTGVCFFGLWDVRMMGFFVLLPLLVCLLAGCFLLLLGFVSLIKVRADLRKEDRAISKMRSYTLRIAVFALSYVLPMVVFVGALLHEYWTLDSWLLTWQDKYCAALGMPCLSELAEYSSRKVWPEAPVWAYLCKYMAILFVPLALLYWLVSQKTVTGWKRFCCRGYEAAAQADQM
ncbi:Frizzled-7 [Hypsibius exemplaris]|uniref:Frizzled-7 n=1 Tax=Hypsibius exemplaris TaxID=2072580 RepID=A0A1W0X791_HYPEX|nr:Frizzled-7 [Hypsibius exemplaris]